MLSVKCVRSELILATVLSESELACDVSIVRVNIEVVLMTV